LFYFFVFLFYYFIARYFIIACFCWKISNKNQQKQIHRNPAIKNPPVKKNQHIPTFSNVGKYKKKTNKFQQNNAGKRLNLSENGIENSKKHQFQQNPTKSNNQFLELLEIVGNPKNAGKRWKFC